MTAYTSHPAVHQNLSVLDANRWFPATYDRGPNWLVWLGILSSFVAIFIKLWTPISINRIPETLYTLPFFYILIKNFRWFIQDRIIQFFLAALMWPIIAFGLLYFQDPELAVRYQKLDGLARIFLFVPIAWWLGGHSRTLGWYLVTAFTGLLMACLLDPELAKTIKLLIKGERIDFNILNAQHVALYFSIALIGVLSVSHHVFSSFRSLFDLWKPAIWSLSLIVCVTVILGTQTRAAWLALSICAGLWIALLGWQFRNRKPGAKFFASVIILVLASGLMGYQLSDRVLQRIQEEEGTLNQIVEGNWDNIPYSSIGIRINTWMEATHWIAEKPFTGWGGDVRQDVIDQSDRFPERIKERFGHFHNSYIEFSLAYGLVGLIILISPFFHLSLKSIKQGEQIPDWIRTFSLYSMAILFVMNFFESYFFFWSGIYVCTAVLVIPYSTLIRARSQS